jgi:hypothetical protein
MRKLVIAALVVALTLSGALVAWARHDETTVDAQFTAGKRDAGTRTNPASNTFRIVIRVGTTTGQGQGETIESATLNAANGWSINSERYPARARCDMARVSQTGSTSVCPPSSRAGRGSGTLKAGSGSITEPVVITIWVSKTGDIFLFLKSGPGAPVELAAPIPCPVSGRVAKCNIPEALQAPAGVKTTIERLVLSLGGSVRVGNRRIHLLTTRSCRGRVWVFGLVLVFDDGGTIRDRDRVPCRR